MKKPKGGKFAKTPMSLLEDSDEELIEEVDEEEEDEEEAEGEAGGDDLGELIKKAFKSGLGNSGKTDNLASGSSGDKGKGLGAPGDGHAGERGDGPPLLRAARGAEDASGRGSTRRPRQLVTRCARAVQPFSTVCAVSTAV